MKTLNELDSFTRAYIMAALWTFDDDAPSGDYETSGRIETLFTKIASVTLERMKNDCVLFQHDNNEDLKAFNPDDAQNGHDFWLTRNHHGTGFWDREQTSETRFEEISERLTSASESWGDASLYFGDDGLIYS